MGLLDICGFVLLAGGGGGGGALGFTPLTGGGGAPGLRIPPIDGLALGVSEGVEF